MNIILYCDSYLFLKISFCNKKLRDKLYSDDIFNYYVLPNYFHIINEVKVNNSNQILYKNLYILQYYLKYHHLKIIKNDIYFQKYFLSSKWAKKLYTYDFRRNMNINNNIIYLDTTVKDIVEEIMQIIYFIKILDSIEKNQKKNSRDKLFQYDIGISFYRTKDYLYDKSEILKYEMYNYINYHYPKYKHGPHSWDRWWALKH